MSKDGKVIRLIRSRLGYGHYKAFDRCSPDVHLEDSRKNGTCPSHRQIARVRRQTHEIAKRTSNVGIIGFYHF